MIFSDSIVDALLNEKPVAPALFGHRQLSYPSDGRARAIFDDQFKQQIIDAKSDLVLIDGDQILMNTSMQISHGLLPSGLIALRPAAGTPNSVI